MEKLVPSIRTSGGTPVGFPDFKPVNRMARHELAGLLRPKPAPLWQVWVDSVGQGRIAVGPKCSQPVASALADAIRVQVGLGRERTWDNPEAAPVGGLARG